MSFVPSTLLCDSASDCSSDDSFSSDDEDADNSKENDDAKSKNRENGTKKEMSLGVPLPRETEEVGTDNHRLNMPKTTSNPSKKKHRKHLIEEIGGGNMNITVGDFTNR